MCVFFLKKRKKCLSVFCSVYLNVLILAVLEPNSPVTCSSGSRGGKGARVEFFFVCLLFSNGGANPVFVIQKNVSIALTKQAVLHLAMQHERNLVLSGFLTQRPYFEID